MRGRPPSACQMEAIRTFYLGFGWQAGLFQWFLQQPLELGFQLGRSGKFTLPDDDYSPAGCFERVSILLVPLDVASELRFPELDVAFRGVALLATLVSMPETSMNENDGVATSEDNIRLAGERLDVQTKPEACAMEH
jgi:hypothetical protein